MPTPIAPLPSSMDPRKPSTAAVSKIEPAVIPTEKLAAMYRTMYLIRSVEESLLELAESGKIGGAMHTAIGHEASAIGTAAALIEGDYLTCTYRGHHHSIARGMGAKEAIAEVLGRSDGFANGKGGSMHFYSPELNLMGANGIVAAQVPHAAGMALASKLRQDGRIAITYFGDRCQLPRRDARNVQHGPEDEAAHHLLLREQPLLGNDAHPQHLVCRRALHVCARLRHAQYTDRRQRRRNSLHSSARCSGARTRW